MPPTPPPPSQEPPEHAEHSVLDRLIGLSSGGPDPGESRRRRRTGRLSRIEEMLKSGRGARPAGGRRDDRPLDWILAAVKEDLRCLLNARRHLEEIDADDPLNRSVLTYGMPDFGDWTPAELRQGGRLAAAVRETIERFEPRLGRVEVFIEPKGAGSEYEMRLRIDAVLELDGAPWPIAFDTVMRLSTREIVIKGEADGA